MSGDVMFLLTCASSAAFAATSVLLLSRLAVSGAPRADGCWPWWMRAIWRPAVTMSPALKGLVRGSRRQQLQKKLEAVELSPGMTPEDWMAMRIVLGTCMAVLLAVAAVALHVQGWIAAITGFAVGVTAPALWLRRTRMDRDRRIVRELPSYLDLLTVCVEAGATLTAGIRLIIEGAPPGPLRSYFDRVLREVRSGRLRSQAFVSVADATGVESLQALAGALAHAESSGMSLGPVLRTQSEQRNAERFVRAERLAMVAPVKMLGPLILCIFPCTFIVLAVPIVHKLVQEFSG